VSDPVVVLAATQRGWGARLRAHAADHGGLRIRATVLTPEDALAEPAAVVLVDDITSFLTPAFVEALHDRGRAVLGLHGAGDEGGRAVLLHAGVDALADAEADPAELLAQIRRLAALHPEDRPPRPRARTTGRGRGRVVGVLGPTGGTGITELALEVAAGLASADVGTVLVDVDELAPGLAQRLRLPVHPNLRTAVAALERAQPVALHLHRLATRRPLHVLPGVAVEADWHTVRPGTVGDLVAALAAETGAVVLDLGHALPRTEGPTGLRFGHALDVAGGCDEVLLAAAPTPQAVARTIGLAARLQPTRARLRVVLNLVGRDRFVRDEAVAELHRATGIAEVVVVHRDEDVPAAGWQGRRVGRGRFRREVGQVVAQLGDRAPGRVGTAAAPAGVP
jgi:Flp pilus assembly CpaE family ATPase